MTLHSKFPPVIQMFFWSIVAYVLAKHFPIHTLPHIYYFTALVAITGAIFLSLALVDFRKHKTTINPLDVTKVSTLVTDGPFRVTRNPMYVGLALLLVAWCLYLSTFSGFFAIPLFLTTMTMLQIKVEERALATQFGEEYREYMKRVNRWLFF